MVAKKVDPASIVSCATFPDAQEAFHLLIEGSGTDAPLTAFILCWHFVTLEASQAHNARAVGMVYAPNTDVEMLNWNTKGHADAIPDLVDRLTDLKTMLIQLRERLPESSTGDAEVYENTKKSMIEAAHASLVNALITVTVGQEGFKKCQTFLRTRHTKGSGMLFLQ
jgi:regulator of replication initiation timing